MRPSTIAIALVLATAPARAEPSTKPQAKQHFKQGKALQDAGKYDDAVAEYRAGQARLGATRIAPGDGHMKFKDVPVGARIGELAARIDELAKAASRSPGTTSNVASPAGSEQGTLGWTARQLRSALEDVRALLDDGVVNGLIAALPETASAARS
jgi:hypothetical protein